MTDDLDVKWKTGAGSGTDRSLPLGLNEFEWGEFSGTITDLDALESDFQLELAGFMEDFDVFVDDLTITCVP